MIETERKFLIKYPDTDALSKLPLSIVKKISQTYLTSENNSTRRVRKIELNGNISYIFTEKIRINALSCHEDEKEILKAEYDALLLEKDTERDTIFKTRYAFPYENQIIEIDIYDFWSEFAILEIELKNENEKYTIPAFVEVIKEVTEDKRFKNAFLASDHNFAPLT